MPAHILMIEDDESLSAMVGEYLEPLGITVTTRPTAASAKAATRPLEDVRLAELQLMETASSGLVAALADAADVLTLEQHTELIAMASKFHR